MRPGASERDAPSEARRAVRRVAVRATLAALVVSVAACGLADLVVANRLQASVDSRLAFRLDAVIDALPRSGPVKPIGTYSPVVAGDLDDAPVVVWWVPDHALTATALDTNAPALPSGDLKVGPAIDATVGEHPFRLAGTQISGGRVIVGTSVSSQRSALSTLLVIEAALGPIAFLALFASAWMIGRQAAAPIERSRRKQLEFTADASHELRTPLSVIEAEVGLALSASRSSAGYRESIERIAGESKRLRAIVEDLLWLSRFESLPRVANEDSVDLAAAAMVCAERFGSIATQHNISITTVEPAPTVHILAPADWLDRLISVLVDNACRYAGDGGTVAISTSVTHGQANLTVEDSGPGIPPDQRELIFERFHRASPVPGGAGLGLAIADVIVQGTGGSWKISTSSLGGARIEVGWPQPGPTRIHRTPGRHSRPS